VNGGYEFLGQVKRLKHAYQQFRTLVWLLDAAIISIALYAIELLLGLPAFTSYYWQGFLPLSETPEIFAIIAGVAIARFLKNRWKEDLFGLLDRELSEKARTACDNRTIKSPFMIALAEDVKRRLAAINPSRILDWRQVNLRLILVALLAAITIFISYSQISADISPADFQSFPNLGQSARELLGGGEEANNQGTSANLSGSIYGKPSLAVLSGEKLELMLYPGMAAGSRSRETSPSDRIFVPGQAGEPAAVPSELYIESLPPQNKEITKRYFENLAQSQ
jgi:hypothetical protein